MNPKRGDILTFDIEGQPLEAEITAIYSQKGLQARFWFERILSEGALDPFIQTYVGAAYMNDIVFVPLILKAYQLTFFFAVRSCQRLFDMMGYGEEYDLKKAFKPFFISKKPPCVSPNSGLLTNKSPTLKCLAKECK